MSPSLLLALALCAQAPAPATITTPDGAVYRVTFTPVSPPAGEQAPQPPREGERLAARASASAQAPTFGMPAPPAKTQPLAMAAPQAVAVPQVALQYQYSQPAAVALAVQPVALSVAQPMATVTLRQPGICSRAVAKVGLAMYQMGQPRLHVVPAAATLQLQQQVAVPQPVQYRATYASAQQ
jgi:hypothetical protein